MKFTRNAVLTEIPNFINLGLSSVHTSDELGSFSITATIIGRPIDGSNWLLPGNFIGEVTSARNIRTRSEQNYISKTDFQTRRGNQYFVHQYSSMSQPHLDSTSFGTNMTNRKMSTINSIQVRTKNLEPTPRT